MRGRYCQSFSIRFAEVDRQGVAFNANYLMYMDETLEGWIATFGDLRQEYSWDMMTKRCTLEWRSFLKQHDVLNVDVAITKWGRTSWSVGFIGLCGSRAIFTAEMVYVSVLLGENTPIETPGPIRDFLGEAVSSFIVCH